MLIIRDPQFRAFQVRLDADFEQRLIAHCRLFFPRASNALGPTLTEAVRETMERARAHGFDTERDLCKYLNLCFTFGRDFDHSPLIAWAVGALESSLPGAVKMERLYAAALQHESEGRGYFARREEPH